MRQLCLSGRRAAKLATKTGTVPGKDCLRDTAARFGYTSANRNVSTDHETKIAAISGFSCLACTWGGSR